MTNPQLAGIYCRLSYAPDGSIEKVERQEEDCRGLAARLDWPVSDQHVYVDNSKSAWQRDRKRPAWDAMLAAVDAREIDSLIVYHGDRLIRQPYDLEKLIGIADSKGIRIASPSGTRSLDNPDDRFVLRIEAAQACRESDNLSRRLKRKIRANAEDGLAQAGGRRPFGYGVPTGQTRTRRDRETGEEYEVPVYDRMQVVPEEARILREAAQRLLAGQTAYGVIQWMNSVSVTTEGGTWNTKNLRTLLTSPRVAGLVEHEGVLYPAQWEGIIEREVWVDLDAYYENVSKAFPYQGRRRTYLLSGVAECSGCTGKLRAKPTGGRNRKTSRIYYCADQRCAVKVGRNVDHLDTYVTGAVLGLLNDDGFRAELHAVNGQEQLGAEIAALERRKEATRSQLGRLADDEELDPAVLALSLSSYDKKIAKLRAQMGLSARRRLLMRMVGVGVEAWEAEPIDIRSATVDALFRVVVHPTMLRGPGFDPGAVKLARKRLD
ncbi:recombinase family protein [Streptomyces sp. NPDC056638]|uniref:recombinase family protein n=1 Tax=Streptomyces sp. NPDC056638 TaxID=3345887 RepID=UPI0036B38AF8